MDCSFKKPPHLAVCLPEIVSNILPFLVPVCFSDEPKKKMYLDLHSCLFVNRLWNDCASRIIWRKAFFEDTKDDYKSFLKFAAIVYKTPIVSPFSNLNINMTKVSSLLFNHDQMDRDNLEMIKYPSRSSSISSVSTFDSIHTPSECSVLDRDEDYPMSEKDNSPETIYEELSMDTSLDYFMDDDFQGRLKTYRNALRCLSIRKIKEKSIHEPLLRIGEHADKLESLDVYICDHFVNDTLYPFIAHRNLTFLSLAGCHHISDEAILKVAEYCKGLEHLDLRACGLVSDVSLSVIAMNCSQLKHLNVGRVRDREKVTTKSIELIAKYTQAAVLGLAGCDVDDKCMEALAKYRNTGLERVSINSCIKITNAAVYAFIRYCPNLSVFEMKECYKINNWEAVAELVQRKVLLTLCDQQNKAFNDWARIRGKILDVKAPLK